MLLQSSKAIRRSTLLTSRPLKRSRARQLQAALQPLEDRLLLAATLWVDPSVAATPGIFATINAAVTAAKIGDTIKVVPGNYTESVDVTKTLTLIGGQQRLSTQAPGASTILPIAGGTFGFFLEANSITIQSFSIQGEVNGIRTNAAWCGYNILHNTFFGNSVGIHLNTITTNVAKTTTVSGNVFQIFFGQPNLQDDVLIDDAGARNVIITSNQFVGGNLDSAIKVNATTVSTNIQILNNDLQFDSEIAVANATNVKIAGNQINPSNKNGIHLTGAVTNSEISGNIIALTAHSGILLDNALSLGANSMNNILKNSIGGSTNGSSIGINLIGASLNTLTGNTVFGMTNGIALSGGSTQNTLTSNTLSNNAIGLHVSASTNNTISKNIANGNRSDGMLFDAGANGNTISQNTANFNTASTVALTDGNGMEFKAANGNTIAQNTTNSNFGDGIVLGAGCTANTLNHNTANNNIATGFDLAGFGLNVLTNNTAGGNLGDGFDLLDQNGDTISSNTATGNLVWGFYVGGTGNVLKSNISSFNGAVGFEIFGNNNTLTNCTANSNMASGIVLASTGNIATGNNAQKNGQYGIAVLISGGGNIITGNSASGNVLFDLFDINGAATLNLWLKNNAKTRSPASLK